MFTALLDSERLLHALVLACDFVHGMAAQKAECTKLPATITDDNFFNNLRKALTILSPVDCLIVKYQSDKVLILDVMPDFHRLRHEFSKMRNVNIITEEERNYLFILAQQRLHFMYGVAHGLLYFLYPALLDNGTSKKTVSVWRTR